MPLSSYIWDVNSPNAPDQELSPSSALCSVAYNPRSPDLLIGGCYNGVISFWDLRKGALPTSESVIESSHHDPGLCAAAACCLLLLLLLLLCCAVAVAVAVLCCAVAVLCCAVLWLCCAVLCCGCAVAVLL